jgi:hypothetical protein
VPTQIARVGDKFVVEIPEELVGGAGFEVSEPLGWVVDSMGGFGCEDPQT